MPHNIGGGIGALYDALLQPELWPGALRQYADRFASTAAILHVENAVYRTHPTWSGVEAAFQELYARSFATSNPLQTAARRQWPGRAYSDRMVFPTGALQQTDWYQAWCRPQDIHGLLGADVIDDERGVVLLGLGRPDPYRDEEVALFDHLMPELRRVMGLRLRLLELDLQRAEMRALLDAVWAPVLLTDETGRLWHANRGADSLLQAGDPLRLSDGRLTALEQHDTDLLRRLLRKASCGDAGGILRFRGGDNGMMGILVMPVRADHGWAEGHERCVAVLVMNPPEQAEPQARLLQVLYGLTPREAAVAVRVCRGEGLPAAAVALDMGTSTARTHLNRVFDKTGTHRQSELAWLLQALPREATSIG
jgi:DNA-binding CsgD family transcriptional regulator